MITAIDELDRLREGNRRFVSGDLDRSVVPNRGHRPELAAGQKPFAIVLACSDSRVPIEFVFDQGFGDLFVIRVAGNIVAPSQIGSVEFAATKFGTRLVIVLGHTNCGAIVATLDELALKESHRSPNLRSIVDRIRPAVESIVAENDGAPDQQVIDKAVRANILASVERLQHGSLLIEDLIANDALGIVGAQYSLEDGTVEFLEAK